MGTMSSGKTFFGEKVASTLGWEFVEADQFHPAANKEKMRAGIPLTDNDRWPWLDAMAAHIKNLSEQGKSAIVTCSALKKIYREKLRVAPIRFIHLYAPKHVLEKRARDRQHEFMNPNLIQSQLNTLEAPTAEADVISINTDGEASEVEQKIRSALQQ